MTGGGSPEIWVDRGGVVINDITTLNTYETVNDDDGKEQDVEARVTRIFRKPSFQNRKTRTESLTHFDFGRLLSWVEDNLNLLLKHIRIYNLGTPIISDQCFHEFTGQSGDIYLQCASGTVLCRFRTQVLFCFSVNLA